jgi:hypothetical protein
MSSIRPEVLALVQAAQSLLSRITDEQPLSDEEADEISCCLAKIEEHLNLNGDGTFPVF